MGGNAEKTKFSIRADTELLERRENRAEEKQLYQEAAGNPGETSAGGSSGAGGTLCQEQSACRHECRHLYVQGAKD